MMRVSVVEELSTFTVEDEERYESVVKRGMSDLSPRSLVALGVPERELTFMSPDRDGQVGIDPRAFSQEGVDALLSNRPAEEPPEGYDEGADV